eukprot:TRINITY_DN50346_c0_g2_i1.p1 TRINITY_DN50346_c0_g2~~TRINITY_DN50346_c0_g2_i1.p1  ORF type:complete len:497 (-),score=101.14 TRINITY_DN50346_c0_g2_i1:399-1889(-)
MPPREVICELCGGKFFQHSLPHHQKTCVVKMRTQAFECPYCSMAVTQLEIDSHILTCKAAKAAGALPTGQSKLLRQRLQQKAAPKPAAAAGNGAALRGKSGSGDQQVRPGAMVRLDGLRAAPELNGAIGVCERWEPSQERWVIRLLDGQEKALKPQNVSFVGAPTEEPRRVRSGQGNKLPSNAKQGLDLAHAFAPPSDVGLVPCRICARTFSIDRVAKHQSICQKTSAAKRPVFRSEKQRLYCEGGSDGRVIGMGQPIRPSRLLPAASQKATPFKGGRGFPAGTMGWREQSLACRDAIRAARGLSAPSGARQGRGQGSRFAAPTQRGRPMPPTKPVAKPPANKASYRPSGGAAADAAARARARPPQQPELPAFESRYAAGRGVAASPGGAHIGVGMSKAARQHAAGWEGMDLGGGGSGGVGGGLGVSGPIKRSGSVGRNRSGSPHVTQFAGAAGGIGAWSGAGGGGGGGCGMSLSTSNTTSRDNPMCMFHSGGRRR